MNTNIKIFSGTGSQYLAQQIAVKMGEPLGKINIQKFSDGEIGVEFKESIRGQFVFLVQSTFAPTDNMMELLLMIDAAKRASAKEANYICLNCRIARASDRLIELNQFRQGWTASRRVNFAARVMWQMKRGLSIRLSEVTRWLEFYWAGFWRSISHPLFCRKANSSS